MGKDVSFRRGEAIIGDWFVGVVAGIIAIPNDPFHFLIVDIPDIFLLDGGFGKRPMFLIGHSILIAPFDRYFALHIMEGCP